MRKNLSALNIFSFESRMAPEMESLIRRHKGIPIVTPSLREIPLKVNREALTFIQMLLAGQIDTLILMTGVGTRFLVRAAEAQNTLDAFKKALSKTRIVARGPKPVKVLRDLGLEPDILVPEPNTWHEILSQLDKRAPVKNLCVAVQEYGISNTDFLNALKSRGAKVIRIPVYQWALPEDTGPLTRTLGRIADGEADVLIFTNAAQVTHIMQLTDKEGLTDSVREAINQCCVASIGPTTSETLKEHGFTVDFEPSRSKMGILVREVSLAVHGILKKKRQKTKDVPLVTVTARASQKTSPADDALTNSVFLKACRREKTEYTPIWLMRQAGRYMPEYRKIRARHGILEIAKTPELACEVTVTAAEKLGVDAAIIFADILLILEPMGVGVEFIKGEGPVIHRPVRSRRDIELLEKCEPETSLAFVYDALRLVRRALKPDLPLIGFSAAPFTLASYLVEGGPSKNYMHTKSLMHADEKAWHQLMEFIVEATAVYLNHQIQAGAQAVQIFDSWVGTLSPYAYERFVLPHSKRLIESVTRGTPVIHFGTGNAALIKKMSEAGGHVMGVDWRVELNEAWQTIGYDKAIMGNLDPITLLSKPEIIRREAERILCQAGNRPGHIFNLGHGVIPQIPVDHVIALVESVHALSRKKSRLTFPV